MNDKEKQIEEMAKIMRLHICKDKPCKECNCHGLGNKSSTLYHCDCYYYAQSLVKQDYRKISKDDVVISKEEYNELINLQRTHAEDLTNVIQSYEESKKEIKIEYINHIKNLEKTIDRQSKDLNSQADRIIDLKRELENKSKETAEKIIKLADKKLDLYKNGVIGGSLYDNGYQTAIYDIKRTIKEKFGVEIKEEV